MTFNFATDDVWLAAHVCPEGALDFSSYGLYGLHMKLSIVDLAAR